MLLKTSLVLSAGFLAFCLNATPVHATSPVQAAGKDHPATVAAKEAPIQQQHLNASEKELSQIRACAKAKGIEDIQSETLNEEQNKIVDQCYRENGVVPPRDMKSYDTMKGQYY